MKLSLSQLVRIAEDCSSGFYQVYPIGTQGMMYFRVKGMPHNPTFRVSLSYLFENVIIGGMNITGLDSKTMDETLVAVEQVKLVEIVTKEWRPV